MTGNRIKEKAPKAPYDRLNDQKCGNHRYGYKVNATGKQKKNKISKFT